MYLLLSLFFFCVSVIAQSVITPFVIDGGLDRATVDGTDYNSGGTIVVRGWTVTIPQNLQVQFPAAFVPFPEFVKAGYTGHEVSVVGNVVDGKAIAGLVSIAQFQLEGGAGVVGSVNNDGSMTIVGGPKIRVNDPNGVFGAPYTTNPMYTADDENPSVMAFSGFPMCIPRSADDPKCPSTNRPAGQRSFTPADPLTMAPFQVGDYLEYSGVNFGGEIVCYEIVAPNVQITTPSGPTYIRVEDSIIGVFDGSANSEFGDTRFIGYSSNPAAAINVYAIDVDPCTGVETERSVGAAVYKAGDARNKWTWRADSTTGTKYTREYMIRASTGDKLTNNGITAGKYVQPVTEWIFPEANVPGIMPPVNDFSNLNFLSKGLGRDEAGNLWGPLSPWPGANAPAAASCAPATPSTPATSAAPPADTATGTVPAPASSTPAAPTGTPSASAGAAQSIRPGTLVSLSGSVSNKDDFPANDLTYTWSQVSGPAIKLSATNVLAPSFTAPAAAAKTSAVFSLSVKSTVAGTTSSSTVTITEDPAIKDVVTIDSYSHTATQSGTISVTAHSNVIDGSMSTMKLYLSVPFSGTPIAMTHLGGGKFSYGARSVKKPATGITVQSGPGATASLTATNAKRRRGMFGFRNA